MLSAGYGFRKETIAGVRDNGRDAPRAAVRSGDRMLDADETVDGNGHSAFAVIGFRQGPQKCGE
jgi:hypothetical protein